MSRYVFKASFLKSEKMNFTQNILKKSTDNILEQSKIQLNEYDESFSDEE